MPWSGRTAGDRGPALAARRRYLRTSEQDLFDAIKHGIAGTLMPASPLPDADISKIVAYIRSLRATAIDTPVEGDVARGGQIFEGKGRCRECHMLNGRGGLLGPDLSNIASERSVRFLQESLTTAKPHIPHGYQPVRVVTADGRQIRGVVKKRAQLLAAAARHRRQAALAVSQMICATSNMRSSR